ncbi:hypothetical protein J437_LFUL003938 [Ladona fulva]|uniref:Uncharacterized protein n=1 Tax=Ladona fulva TaxID=123851 RepID=A0A8K0K9R7_LADFU|nr:hypothetical protein J437_LFUL003938 [Ladona fulva]
MDLIFHMRNFKISTLQGYWRIFCVIKRFTFVNCKCLHYVNHREEPSYPSDPSFKIGLLLKLFRPMLKKLII